MLLLDTKRSAPDIEQGVIEEARRRQRRRRSIVAAVSLAATVVRAAAYVTSGGSGHSPRPAGPPTPSPRLASQQSPERLFAQEPSMGVACHVPNSIACDRVMLAVWLRRPAVAVDAVIAGRAFKLDDREWSGPSHNGRRTMFAGALQPAGLINGPLTVRPDRGRYYWIGSHPVFARVSVAVDYGRGETVSTTFDLQLRPGWG